jgi:adenylyltransferase/sulfurtransferase
MNSKTNHPTVSDAALAEIYAHAVAEYPRECCGIVLGSRDDDMANKVRVCANIQDILHAEDPVLHARDSRTAYNMNATDLFALQKSLRSDLPAKVVYHSHADVGAYFSDTDQAAARMDGEPTYPVEYLVVDVRADGPHGAAQFAWDPQRGQYEEVRRYRFTSPVAPYRT